jgi:osmotically-inducible protein OsmY
VYTRFALIAVALLLSAAQATAEDPKDFQIFKDISAGVGRYTQFTVFDDLNATVENGVVTLTGKVTMPYKLQDIERMVARIDGVQKVNNQITVLPVSSFDEQLRYWIARSIYGNSSFWTYASMPNPPIHIVVEHQHVTLTGVVASNVERVLARSIALQSGALSVTDNLLTDAEMQERLEKFD